MAKTVITESTLALNTWGNITFTAGVKTGVDVPATNADFKRLILVNNTTTSAVDVTVKAGNGIQGVQDLETYSVPANTIAAIRLDDGRFKNVSGEDNGNIVVATTAQVAVVELP